MLERPIWFRFGLNPQWRQPGALSRNNGDAQVLAACEQCKVESRVLDLDVLAEFPSVESVVASTRFRAPRQLSDIRELLLCPGASYPDATTLRHLTGLEAIYATFGSDTWLDLDALPARQVRKLAQPLANSPLEEMTGLDQLRVDLFRDSRNPLAGMKDLKYLSINGPAKGWAKLRECAMLEEAHSVSRAPPNPQTTLVVAAIATTRCRVRRSG